MCVYQHNGVLKLLFKNENNFSRKEYRDPDGSNSSTFLNLHKVKNKINGEEHIIDHSVLRSIQNIKDESKRDEIIQKGIDNFDKNLSKILKQELQNAVVLKLTGDDISKEKQSLKLTFNKNDNLILSYKKDGEKISKEFIEINKELVDLNSPIVQKAKELIDLFSNTKNIPELFKDIFDKMDNKEQKNLLKIIKNDSMAVVSVLSAYFVKSAHYIMNKQDTYSSAPPNTARMIATSSGEVKFDYNGTHYGYAVNRHLPFYLKIGSNSSNETNKLVELVGAMVYFVNENKKLNNLTTDFHSGTSFSSFSIHYKENYNWAFLYNKSEDKRLIDKFISSIPFEKKELGKDLIEIVDKKVSEFKEKLNIEDKKVEIKQQFNEPSIR